MTAEFDDAGQELARMLAELADLEAAYRRHKTDRTTAHRLVLTAMTRLGAKTLDLPGDGQVTRVRPTTIRITSEPDLLAWVRTSHPDQIHTTEAVRPAWLRTLKHSGRVLFDPATGAVVPGMAIEDTEPYLKINLSKE